MNIDRPNAGLGRYDVRLGYGFSWGKAFNDFARLAQIRLPEGVEGYGFAASQLRRAFSVTYYKETRVPTRDFLSRFLRPSDQGATRRYISKVFGDIPGHLRDLAKAHKGVRRPGQPALQCL